MSVLSFENGNAAIVWHRLEFVYMANGQFIHECNQNEQCSYIGFGCEFTEEREKRRKKKLFFMGFYNILSINLSFSI